MAFTANRRVDMSRAELADELQGANLRYERWRVHKVGHIVYR
jgi:hypothetical protein